MQESDGFWHLSLGRAVATAGSRVISEPTSIVELASSRAVPEWLWDVSVWVLYRLGGWTLLSVSLLVAGAALGWLASLVLRAGVDDAPAAPLLALAALATPALVGRLRERPETAATLLLLTTVVLSEHYRARPPNGLSDAARASLPLALVTLVWAQVHSTAVLAPAIVACGLLTPLAKVRAGSVAQFLRTHGPLSLAVLVLPLTGATGVGIVTQVGLHIHSDAARHIADLQPTSWSSFDPTVSIGGSTLPMLLALGVGGALVTRRADVSRVALAIVGIGVGAAASRGLALGALLALPFSRDGALALWDHLSLLAPRLSRALALTLSAALFIRTGSWVQQHRGPLGRLGLSRTDHPLAAVHALSGVAPETRVFTDFGAGAALGFLLDGRVRTFVDSRTPMHFDDTAFGISRDTSNAATSLPPAFARYRFAAAVVSHTAPLCGVISRTPGWRSVALDALYTTFVRDDLPNAPPALVHLAPCEVASVLPSACSAEGLREVSRAAEGAGDGFDATLRVAWALRCGGAPSASDRRSLPSRLEARQWSFAWESLMAHLALRDGRLDDAVSHAQAMASAGHLELFRDVAPPLLQARRWAALRGLYEHAVGVLDDQTPADVRADLAIWCANLNDVDCVRFHATRAAAGGSARAAIPLRWLSRHGADERTRSDARAWLVLLNAP